MEAHGATIQELREHVAAMQAAHAQQLASVQADNERLRQENTQLSELRDHGATVQELRADCDRLTRERSQYRVRALTAELAVSQAELAMARAEYEALARQG